MSDSPRPSPSSRKPVLLNAAGICKKFGDFTANDDVSFSIGEGEIHALLGENGAGKSTFVKMVYGLLQPDSGEFEWRGRPVAIRSPQHARDLGIGMVFQHFSLFQALTVAENIALALPPVNHSPIWPIGCAACRPNTASASTHMPASTICRLDSSSASRSSAACCRTRHS